MIEMKIYGKKNKVSAVKRLSLDELYKKALMSRAKCGQYKTIVTRFNRDESVSSLAKRLANGICQLCQNISPFCDKDRNPYLETHHVVWLSEGGDDTIHNTAALCPNCHKKMHILNNSDDRVTISANIKSLLDRAFTLTP